MLRIDQWHRRLHYTGGGLDRVSVLRTAAEWVRRQAEPRHTRRCQGRC